jgi:hypothetical protein
VRPCHFVCFCHLASFVSTLMNANRPAALLLLRSLIVTLAWGGAFASAQAAPVVSNLTAAQRAGTKLVDITYDFDSCRFSRATWTVSVTSAKEGIGTNAYPVTGRTMTCNGVIDRPRSFSARMRFQVKIDNAIIPPVRFAASNHQCSEPRSQRENPEYQARDTRAPILCKLPHTNLSFCGHLNIKPRLTHSI